MDSITKNENLATSIELCYKRGTLIGLKEAMILLKGQEIELQVHINDVLKEIKELEDDQNK